MPASVSRVTTRRLGSACKSTKAAKVACGQFNRPLIRKHTKEKEKEKKINKETRRKKGNERKRKRKKKENTSTN
jgi:hypothetical protein